MSRMYPNDQILEIFGEQVKWPGLGPDGKFTNGDFKDPLIKPSFIPAETINLLIDNMETVIKATGLKPNNIEPDQLMRALQEYTAPREVGEYHGPFLVSNGKRKLLIKAGTKIPLGSRRFRADEDTALDAEPLLDTGGALAGGKDYYVFLCPGAAGGGVVTGISLAKTAPAGFDAADVRLIGGFHTLCADAGTGMAYAEGGETKAHPLNGYVAGDILPYSVWCLNHRPHSEPEGMVYIPSLDFWCDIYLQSGSGKNTKSAYRGAVTRGRQYVDHVEDQFCVKKELLDDGEFSAAMLGSNEMTAAGPGSAAAGGRLDTGGRRMISIYGVEEGCGLFWQWLRGTSAAGMKGMLWGQTSADGVTPVTYGMIDVTAGIHGPYGQSGGKGRIQAGIAGALLAGGYRAVGEGCGSRARLANYARSLGDGNAGGRGRSRAMRVFG